MLKIYDVGEAQKTILKRIPPDETDAPPAVLERIAATFGERINAEEAVRRILRDVRSRGDAALREWSAKLDGFPADAPIRVPAGALSAALEALDPETRAALEVAADRIREFYRRQPLSSWFTNDLGGTLGQFIRPIQRVGLYTPGGTAPLPSTVLMSAIPAQVAGVKEIVIVTPPQRGTGQVSPVILAACALCGVTEVYAMGGAQAIAAIAYGTESVPAVDKIFGPGNLFVTLAKRQVFGAVGIDGLAGPTETVVIADENAKPAWVAADLLAQAEHDVLASAILLTPSRKLAETVQVEVGRQMETLPRADILAQSLPGKSGIVITKDLDEAAALNNAYAPEHLCLAVADPWALSEKISNAGGIFMGEHSFEVLGDYVAGPSHVMPTGGSARFASPLNVWDFVHIISLIALNPATTAQIAPLAAKIARAEGLEAHARSADCRVESEK
ncbi:MAG: histidinol dehydrogenase [Chloroflexi bacterium HGW-Chloroflexi-6]|nr:MAG: histidinol dehydrogenase [Chloroflexi bacterium HGW-Chloroflexi-6]